MTTTAEKIKVMQAFEDGQKIEFIRFQKKDDTRPATRGWVEWNETWEEPLWDWDLCDYRIKPPNPEPLECWANVHKHPNRVGRYVRAFLTFAEAKERCHVFGVDPITREQVRMREVTPQMLENEKDAARYRWWKYNRIAPGSQSADPSYWDEIADKAMEEE